MEAGLKHWQPSELGGTCLAIMDVQEMKIQPISVYRSGQTVWSCDGAELPGSATSSIGRRLA
jgi:hypothetical protein